MPRATLRRERRLPIAGDVLVTPGNRVTAEQIVMRTNLPGKADLVNVVSMLGILPGELPRFMVRRIGDTVNKGELIAESRSFFGLFTTRVEAPLAGTLEAISTVTGQVTFRGAPLPVEVCAYIDGTVVEVHERQSVTVETTGAFVQGIFGIGGETAGVIMPVVDGPDDVVDEDSITADNAGAIVVGGARATLAAVRKAVAVGARAIVVGGFDDADLRMLLGYDLGVAITGHETVGITMLLTEGFGHIPMAGKTFALLSSLRGCKASINGQTQIRAGVLRPEIIVPDPAAAAALDEQAAHLLLDLGARVRCIREPHFGALGTVVELPVEPIELPTESRARVAIVRLDDGTQTTMPRANLEVIAGG